MGTSITVYVLIAVSTIAPFKHPHDTRLMREHLAVFGSEERCQAERRAMDYNTLHIETYFCQKELLK
jgi:hypothetical protein